VWTVLGAPIDSSGASRGEQRAPDALRAAGLPAVFGAADIVDVAPPLRGSKRDRKTGVIAFADLCVSSQALRAAVVAALTRGERPLVLGGDCSLLLGAIAGVRDAVGRVGLWFVDGHAVVILGHRPASLHPDVALELGRVPAAIARMTAEEVAEAGPTEVGKLWERAFADRGPAWLHLDLDVLDETALPAVTYPQPRGLDWDAFVALARPLMASDALVGVSVADFNPDLDEDGTHARRVVDALASALQ